MPLQECSRENHELSIFQSGNLSAAGVRKCVGATLVTLVMWFQRNWKAITSAVGSELNMGVCGF